jgi:hypothetical protein
MNRWLSAQRIGISAFCVREFNVTRHAEHFQQCLADEVQKYRSFCQGDVADSMKTLPLPTLQLLRRLKHLDDTCDVPGMAKAVEEAIDRTVSAEVGSLIAKCNLFAHQVLHSSTPPRAINALAQSLFTIQYWARLPVGAEPKEFDNRLANLRSNDCPTAIKLTVIPLFVKSLLIDDEAEAAQLENVLFQHAFSWPLLTFESAGDWDVAVSVPVAVDARFDVPRISGEDAKPIGERTYLCGADHFDLQTPDDQRRTFASYLRGAVDAAHALWQSAHGHTGTDWRERVETVPVVFDFSYASVALEALVSSDVRITLRLRDGSAGAYFSQVVLARLLGRSAFLSSAMTGTIGERIQYRDGKDALDYKVGTVGDIEKKLRWVFESHMFERVIIPNDDELEALVTRMVTGQGGNSSSSTFKQTAEMRRAATLSTAADICQVMGWRRYYYVRCPDVGRAIHGPKDSEDIPVDLVPSSAPEFAAVHRQLGDNQETIVSLRDVSTVAVASYLWHINRVLLPEVGRQWKHRPPALSWAFIRVEEYEKDASFWHVLWRIIGAPGELFDTFRCSPTRAAALTTLGRVLNTFEPTDDARAHRAPDVLVLIGPERLCDKNKIYQPAQRPLQVLPILEELGRDRRLNVCEPRRPSSKYFSLFHKWLGSARIIRIPEPLAVTRLPQPLHIKGRDLDILDRLRVFHRSFSQHMAASVLHDLEIEGQEVREHLDRFENNGLLQRFAGDWFFPVHVRSDIQSRKLIRDQPELALRHFAAGMALAPYCSTPESSSLAHDAALLPERAHEAQEHFIRAFKLFANDPRNQTAERALSWLCRFGPSAGWGAITELIKRKGNDACRDAYLSIEEYMEGWRNHPSGHGKTANHPSRLALAARALRFFIPGNAIKILYGHVADDKDATIRRLFARAQAACEAFPDERDFNRLKVLSEYADYLYDRYLSVRDDTGHLKGDCQNVDREILEMEQVWEHCPGAILGSWWDNRGDLCSDHENASVIYAEGITFAGEYQQLKVKAAGAMSLGKRCHPLMDQCRRLREDQALVILRAAKKGYDRERQAWEKRISRRRIDPQLLKQWENVINPRWSAGRAFLSDAWKTYPECAQILAAFENRPWARPQHQLVADNQEIPQAVLSRLLPGYRPGRITKLGQGWTNQGYGFVRSNKGKDYHFDESRLADGLSFGSLQKLQCVQFTATAEPGPENKNRGEVHELRVL